MNSVTWSSYSDFYRKSKYSTFKQQHSESKGKFPFRMIMVDQDAHNFTDPVLDETIISLPLHTEPNCRWSWSIKDRNYSQISRPGQMLVVPSNTESDWEVNAKRTLLVLALPNRTAKMILGGACPSSLDTVFEPLTCSTWENEFVQHMLRELWVCTNASSLNNTYLSDGLIMSILSQLINLSGAQLENPSIALPQWRLNKVLEYVNQNISNEISIEKMSEAAGLSSRHFSRSFQKETGNTPFKWVMELRLRKSMNLLLQSKDSLNDIALACGFSSQSHFSTSFKSLTGLTPFKWRQSNLK